KRDDRISGLVRSAGGGEGKLFVAAHVDGVERDARQAGGAAFAERCSHGQAGAGVVNRRVGVGQASEVIGGVCVAKDDDAWIAAVAHGLHLGVFEVSDEQAGRGAELRAVGSAVAGDR